MSIGLECCRRLLVPVYESKWNISTHKHLSLSFNPTYLMLQIRYCFIALMRLDQGTRMFSGIILGLKLFSARVQISASFASWIQCSAPVFCRQTLQLDGHNKKKTTSAIRDKAKRPIKHKNAKQHECPGALK